LIKSKKAVLSCPKLNFILKSLHSGDSILKYFGHLKVI
jgi:hypothetical protein